MRNFLKALILFPVAILVVLLAVANRGPVTLSLDPFDREVPEIAFTVPLFAVIFGSVMLGVVIGGIPAWTGSTGAGAGFLGVKLVSVFPGNAAKGLPRVIATYLLMDGATGAPLAT